MKDKLIIPSRDEHDRFIKRIWKWCLSGACLVFAITATVTSALALLGFEAGKILTVSTIVFQILVLSYGMGFFVPAFCTSLIKMSLGVEMSRRGIEIGNDTVKTLEQITPVVEDLKGVVHSIKEILGHFQSQDIERVRRVVNSISKFVDDKESTEKISGLLSKQIREAEGQLEQLLWTKIDEFLSSVFNNKEDSNASGSERPSNGSVEPEGAESRAEAGESV
jgi:hypothetical protein